MDASELKEVTPLIEGLYKRRNKGWRPILAFGFEGGAVTWAPKKDEGASPPSMAGVTKLGVWGGTVESYQLGFNQQSVQLLWAGIDVDAKGGHNEGVRDLPRRVADVLPEAMVRASSSGSGSHVFLHLEEPRTFSCKEAAQAAAEAMAAPYVRRLKAEGIDSDIVGRNQLWVWGGHQRDVQTGRPVPAGDLSTFDREPVVFQPASGSISTTDRGMFGPMCSQILDALETNGVIRFNGGVSRRYLLHIVRCQAALAGLPWLRPALNVRSTGNRLNEPNSTLTVENGLLVLWTFVDGGRVVFRFPIGL